MVLVVDPVTGTPNPPRMAVPDPYAHGVRTSEELHDGYHAGHPRGTTPIIELESRFKAAHTGDDNHTVSSSGRPA